MVTSSTTYTGTEPTQAFAGLAQTTTNTKFPVLNIVQKQEHNRFTFVNNDETIRALGILKRQFDTATNPKEKNAIINHIANAVFDPFRGYGAVVKKVAAYIRPNSQHPGRFDLSKKHDDFDTEDASFYPATILQAKQLIKHALESDTFSLEQIQNTITNISRIAYQVHFEYNQPYPVNRPRAVATPSRPRMPASRQHFSLHHP